MSNQSQKDIAHNTAIAFFDAIEAGRVDDAVSYLASDAEIWHNTDEKVVSRTMMAKTLAFMHKALADIKYEGRRLNTWPGGFSEQHALTGIRKSDGRQVRLAASIICQINADGKITRLDEYFDGEKQREFTVGYRRTSKM